MPNLILKENHKYKHYNRAMGKWIHSKEHYEHEMKKGGYITYDECEKRAAKWDKDHPRHEYTLSPKAEDLIKSVKLTAKHGYIRLADYPKIVEELKKMGMSFDSSYLPKEFTLEGGMY